MAKRYIVNESRFTVGTGRQNIRRKRDTLISIVNQLDSCRLCRNQAGQIRNNLCAIIHCQRGDI